MMAEGCQRFIDSNMNIAYWFKFVVIWILIKLRPYLSSTRTSGFGKRKKFSSTEKESTRNFKEDGFSIDASYFNGFDFESRFLGLGMQRRPDGSCENVFFIRIPELGLEPLVLPMNPSTWTTLVHDEWRTEEGLTFYMDRPMNEWTVSFRGNLVELESRRPHKIAFEFKWIRKSLVFDADTDMDSVVMAHALASERWSRSFFAHLQELHQTHYEVFGELTGKIVVDDEPALAWNLISMKDRSYGKHRFWGDFRRYILHYLGTQDGLYIGCHFVSITKTFTHLLVGFVVNSRGKKTIITHSTQTLWSIGEDQLPFHRPYCFQLTDTEGTLYMVEIQVMDRIKFFCGPDKEGTLFSSYVSGTVNGIPACGLCEYEYNSRMYQYLLNDTQ